MDLSIITNFLNFLLSYNIIFFLKLCFKISLGPQVSDYAELTPISTVVSLYNDLFRLFFIVGGAVAHGFSFREHRLSTAERAFEKVYNKRHLLGTLPNTLHEFMSWKNYARGIHSVSLETMSKMTSEEKKDFEEILKFMEDLSQENDPDLWKICLFCMTQKDLYEDKFSEDFRDLKKGPRKPDLRLTESTMVRIRITLGIAEKLRIQDLEVVYILGVKEGRQEVGFTVYSLGSKIFTESSKRYDRSYVKSSDNAKIQNIMDSVAHKHNLESEKLYAAVIHAIEAYAFCKRDAVRDAYKASGVLYNSPPPLGFADENLRVSIETSSPSKYKGRDIMIAVNTVYKSKISKAVIYCFVLRHYFAMVLFGAGQVIGITLLGANVWNPFDSSNAHTLRDILRNNIKYTTVLTVLSASNLLVPLIEECAKLLYKYFEGEHYSDKFSSQISEHNFKEFVMSTISKALDFLRRFECSPECCYFTDDSYYVLNVQTLSTMSIYIDASDKILTFSKKNHLHEVSAELNIVYFFVNFIALPIAMMRYSRLYTRLFGEAYTDL